MTRSSSTRTDRGPGVLSRLIDDGLVDFIAMDLKAPLARYDVLAGTRVEAANIAESIRLIAGSAVARQFRTTVVPRLLGVDDLAQIRRLVPEGEELQLQTFQPEHALDPQLRGQSAEPLRPALAG